MFSRHFRRGQYDREHATGLKVTELQCRLRLCLRVRRSADERWFHACQREEVIPPFFF